MGRAKSNTYWLIKLCLAEITFYIFIIFFQIFYFLHIPTKFESKIMIPPKSFYVFPQIFKVEPL